MLKPSQLGRATLLLALFAALAQGETGNSTVHITQDLPNVTVLHQGKPIVIARNPDTENMIEPDFALTSRPCPPFCILPMSLHRRGERCGNGTDWLPGKNRQGRQRVSDRLARRHPGLEGIGTDDCAI